MGDAAFRFWTSPEFPRLYREYLFISHAIVRASAPLMEAAEEACGYTRHAGDAVMAGFGSYLRHHIQEETGHEEWIVNDAESIGIERDAILGHLPNETVVQMVGAQYYWIRHYHPIALAGYIAVMEGNPPVAEFIEEIAHQNNMSTECFSGFLYHAKLDPRHKRDLDDLFDALPLTADHLSLIGISSIHTLRSMVEIMFSLAGATNNDLLEKARCL